MWFALASLAFMLLGRKLGWAVSRAILYPAPIVVSALVSVLWGILVGIGVSWLIGWQQPNTALKWILGFGMGAYVSIPNFGLVNQNTIADFDLPRHFMISNLPMVSFIVTEFLTRSLRSRG
jgi:uncharacterized membrane protein AbrB (regulator of aidB expression)